MLCCVWLTCGAVRRGDEEMAVEVRACSRAGLEGGSECGLCRWPGLNGGSECGLWDPSLSLPWLLGGVGGKRRCSSVWDTEIILKHLKHPWLMLNIHANPSVKMGGESLSNDRPKCESEIQSIHLSSRKVNKVQSFRHFAHSTCMHNDSKCGGCWSHHEFLSGDVPAYTQHCFNTVVFGGAE